MTSHPDRRAVLKTVAAAGLLAALPAAARPAGDRPAWQANVAGYLAGLARPDGGYGWDDQEHSHLTPTFAAIGCHRLLKLDPPDTARLAEFVRTHHPFRLKKL